MREGEEICKFLLKELERLDKFHKLLAAAPLPTPGRIKLELLSEEGTDFKTAFSTLCIVVYF